MTGVELLLLLGLLAVTLFWLDTLRARETALLAAQRACQAQGLQLLDGSVVQAHLSLQRDDEGRLRLRRVYRFEYSDTGNERLLGSVVLLGRKLLLLELGHHHSTLTVIEGGRSQRDAQPPL